MRLMILHFIERLLLLQDFPIQVCYFLWLIFRLVQSLI